MTASLVVSPHLDDAVLGCGAWIAAHPGARVLTVFAGVPPEPATLTAWDAACGFASAGEAIVARRSEDRAACALLGAEAEWMDWCDDQYRVPAPPDAVAGDLCRALERHDPATVLVPLGLFHRDHELAHAAAVQALAALRPCEWYAYEDALYRAIPGLVQRRLAALERQGLTATPAPAPAGTGAKRRALACYASQLRGLATPGRPGHADALAAERLWRLSAA
jgi:LmbE family N-acetylglucosaminyl deacetylase